MKNTSKALGFDADFDTFWKEALNLVELATSFFLPDLHRDVDWSHNYKPLEQELRSLFRGRKGRLKRTDKLFRLQLKDGTDRVVFFHVEAEAFPDKKFPRRMLEYYMLLNLKFGFAPITLLAIFVGEKPKTDLSRIKIENYGTRHELQYNIYSVAGQSEAKLLADKTLSHFWYWPTSMWCNPSKTQASECSKNAGWWSIYISERYVLICSINCLILQRFWCSCPRTYPQISRHFTIKLIKTKKI